MSRSPDAAATQRAVRKRDGRTVPFDAERLCASIRAALAAAGNDQPRLGDDLGSVVITYIESHGKQACIGTAEIAELVRQVLASSGWENGAYMFERVRAEREARGGAVRVRAPGPRSGGEDALPLAAASETPRFGAGAGAGREAWSKGRVVALLERETDLGAGLAADVAAEVERGLFASGLASVSTALLREWVDEVLQQRGLAPRLGQRREVFVEGRELRDLLAQGPAGPAAEAAASARVFERYALTDVYPPAVARAHEQGLLHLDGLGRPGRADSAALPLSLLLAPDEDACDGARLARLLHGPAAGCDRELLVLWDRAAPDTAGARALLLGLAGDTASPPGTARVVLCLPAEPDLVAPFLDATAALRRDPRRRGWRLPVVRVCGPTPSAELLAEVLAHESVDAGWQFASALPQPLRVGASVTLNLPRLVLNGSRDTSLNLLQRFERTLDLGLSALAARTALLSRHAPGRGGSVTVRRLGLCGAEVAAALLARPDDAPHLDAPALLVAVGAGLRSRGVEPSPAGAPDGGAALGEGGLLIDRASAEAVRHCGQADRRLHPEATARLTLDAERRRYRYDVPHSWPADTSPEIAGRRAARAAATYGLPAWAPAPRVSGADALRARYLAGYLAALLPNSPTTQTPESSACS